VHTELAGYSRNRTWPGRRVLPQLHSHPRRALTQLIAVLLGCCHDSHPPWIESLHQTRGDSDREAGGDEQPLSHGHPRESPNGQRAEDPAADDGHDDDQQARAEGGDLWKKNMEFSTGKADSVPFSVVQNDCGK